MSAETPEIEKPTLGRLLDRLEAKGWVKREHDAKDRRVWRVHLTDVCLRREQTAILRPAGGRKGEQEAHAQEQRPAASEGGHEVFSWQRSGVTCRERRVGRARAQPRPRADDVTSW